MRKGLYLFFKVCFDTSGMRLARRILRRLAHLDAPPVRGGAEHTTLWGFNGVLQRARRVLLN